MMSSQKENTLVLDTNKKLCPPLDPVKKRKSKNEIHGKSVENIKTV